MKLIYSTNVKYHFKYIEDENFKKKLIIILILLNFMIKIHIVICKITILKCKYYLKYSYLRMYVKWQCGFRFSRVNTGTNTKTLCHLYICTYLTLLPKCRRFCIFYNRVVYFVSHLHF